MSGFLLIDKPANWTSHDVVGYLRKVTDIKKIGHAGTLDPFATGLLIVGIGREATRRLDEFKGMPKTYIATLQLGATSDTFDSTGTILKHESMKTLKQIELNDIEQDKICHPERSEGSSTINQKDIEMVLKSFVGVQPQLPPMFSAKKINGEKLYTLARKGIEVEREPNEITIYSVNLLKYIESEQTLEIEVQCSAGTYIRTLANDIGKKLGCGAYCATLRRTKIGEFDVKEAVDVRILTQTGWEDALFSPSPS